MDENALKCFGIICVKNRIEFQNSVIRAPVVRAPVIPVVKLPVVKLPVIPLPTVKLPPVIKLPLPTVACDP